MPRADAPASWSGPGWDRGGGHARSSVSPHRSRLQSRWLLIALWTAGQPSLSLPQPSRPARLIRLSPAGPPSRATRPRPATPHPPWNSNLIRPTRCPRSTLSPGRRLKDNPPRQQPRNLLEVTSIPRRAPSPRSARCGPPRPGSSRSGIGLSGIARSSARHRRRTVYVHVKHAEENTDPLPRSFRKWQSQPSRSPARLPAKQSNPAPAGTVRCGSRKNHRKNAASSTGAMPHAQPRVAHTSAIATASRLKP